MMLIHEIHLLEQWMETNVYDPRSSQIPVQASVFQAFLATV